MSNNFCAENVLNFIKNFAFDFEISSLKNGFLSDIKHLNNQQKYWMGVLRALYHCPKILFIEKLILNENTQIFFDYLINFKQSQNSIIFIHNPPLEFFKKTDPPHLYIYLICTDVMYLCIHIHTPWQPKKVVILHNMYTAVYIIQGYVPV